MQDDYEKYLFLEVPPLPESVPGIASDFAKFSARIEQATSQEKLDAVLSMSDPDPSNNGAKAALDLRDLRSEASAVADPTEAQKDAGNYKKGHVSWKGLPLTIETAKGQYREGKGYKTLMRDHYGYVKGTTGADGDQVDVFLSEEDLDSEIVFCVNQRKKDGSWDEHKFVLGTKSLEQAKKVYLRNYSPGWTGMGEVTPITLDHFKWWLEVADTSKEVKNGYFAAKENLKKSAADPLTGGLLKSGFEEYDPFLLLAKRASDEDDSPFTVAVDLDGTLAETERPFSVKSIGAPRERAVEWVRRFHAAGARVIIFTVRGDKKQVSDWLDEHEVPYDFVNENPDQPEGSSGKVIADCYIDDRAVDGRDPDEYGPEVLSRMLGNVKEETATPQVSITHTTMMFIPASELLKALERSYAEE